MRRVVLGTESIIYIREQLALGRELAKLLERLPLEAGDVVTIAPDGASLERLTQFERGYLLSNGEHVTPEVIQHIATYLRGHGRRYVLFEDPHASPTDPWIGTTQYHQFVQHGREVYHMLTSADLDHAVIERVYAHAGSYPLIGILTCVPETLDLRFGQEISTDDLRVLAAGADELLIGAYDDEGILIWHRPAR